MSTFRKLTTRELKDIWTLLNSYHYVLEKKFDFDKNEMLNFYIDYLYEVLNRDE